MKEERDKAFARCLRTYGERPQVDMAIEEMSELTKALLKMRRAGKDGIQAAREAIIDELADVRIMTRQMEILYQCEDEVERRIDFKVQRQLSRLDRKEAENEKEKSKDREKTFGDKVWEFCEKKGVDVTFVSELGQLDIEMRRGRSLICRPAPLVSMLGKGNKYDQMILDILEEMAEGMDAGTGWRKKA